MASKNEAKIKFTADASEYTQAVKDANSELSSLRAEMRLADAEFKNTGDSAEYQKTKMELLEEALKANHDKQEALTQKLELAKQIYGEDSDEVQKLERSLTYAKTEEQNLLTQLNETNGGLQEQSKAAGDAESSTDKMSEALVNAKIAEKIKEIGEAAIDMAGDYSEASATIVEGTGATGEALVDLNRQAQDAFGRIADADADLNSISGILAELNTRFGVTGDDAEDLSVKISQFAQHTGTDGVRAVDSIANIMKRWGLGMEDVDGLLDDLTTGNQSCQMSVDDLTGYLSKNSTQFQELGYSTEEALGMLISLSDGGADVGSVMSGLTKGIANLSGVTDDVPGAFKDAVSAIGDCDSVAEALQTQVGDTGKTVEQIFGKKAAQELATNILNGSFAIDDWTRKLQENDGALQSTTENATSMQDAWSQAVNNVSLALGSTLAPVISKVVTKLAQVITFVANVIRESPILQSVVIGVAVALGILGAALGISAIIQVVTTAFGMLNTVLLANPIFLVITAIVALVAALVYAYKHSEKFRNIVNKAFNAVKKVALPVLKAIRDFAVKAFQAIKDKVSKLMSQIKEVVSKVWNTIKKTVATVVNAIKTVITSIFGAIRAFLKGDMAAVKQNLTNAWNAIKTAISTVVSGIKTIISTYFNAMRAVISSIMSGIRSVISTVWNAIKGNVSAVLSGINSVVTTAWNGIKTAISTAMSSIKTAISTAWSTIKSMISTALSSIKSTVSTAWSTIKSSISTALSNIKSTVSTGFSNVKTTISTAWSNVKTNTSTAWSNIKSTVSTGISGAKTAVSTAVSGIETAMSGAWSSIKSTASTAWDGIKSAMTSPITTAKETISGIIDKVKGLFPVNLGKIFNLQLPHISVSAGSPPYGIGGMGEKPSFSVSWWAKGAVFNAPTLIPTLNGIHGVGDAGPEAVSPVSVLQSYIATAVQKYSPTIDYDKLGDKVAAACANMNISIDVEKRQLGRVVREVQR